ncbi:GGDEF domain-containing protein [Pelagibacterium sp. 26DY04]|uniref:GGDEF domain-containing protein n=1 Tax=Pelagibacterium sp. 26DY04 TaxID=2967130 RepID=UPI002815F444|nr:GGDEF domain-containing protein [Pelagibacterium sp. 26DY04]WMT86298.1 GGDEF domain-containing protein [Pelagibacterium sp. 26DY04]
MTREFRLPRHAWVSIAARTARHMVFAVAISVAVSYLLLETFSQGIGEIGLIAAIVAPLVLGGPMVFYMSMRQFELQMAYDRLEQAAARDSLTNCFHHGAFVEAVTASLGDAANGGGALLMIDADHFKSINDRFGHASGDTALKLIVSAIRSSMDRPNIIGRVGGEEFGVFLPGASAEHAAHIAETIRRAVLAIQFDTGGQVCTLSVSIGGAVVKEPVQFGDLFRLADERLYKVKAGGRNNIDIVAMPVKTAAPNRPAATAHDLVYRGQKIKQSA